MTFKWQWHAGGRLGEVVSWELKASEVEGNVVLSDISCLHQTSFIDTEQA